MQNRTLKTLGIILAVAAVVFLVCFLFPTLLAAFAPFLIAYLLSLALEPLIRFLNERMRMPRAMTAGICTLLAVGIIGALLTWLGSALWAQLVQLVEQWPALYEKGKSFTTGLISGFDGYYKNLSPQMREYLDYGLEEARAGLTKLIAPVANWLVYLARGLVAGMPEAIIFIIVTFLACNFMCAEKRTLRAVLVRMFGEKAVGRVGKIWRDLKSALGGYIKAQLSIMCVSCIILFIGFTIAGVRFNLLLAVAVAILDALPVFGSGAVLLPWALVSLLQGEYIRLLILLCMYITIIVTRQILEPRILGKHIGVPPLLTLMSMYVGLKFIGIFGMVLGPVIVLIIKNLYEGGVFTRSGGEPNEDENNKNETIPKEVQDQ